MESADVTPVERRGTRWVSLFVGALAVVAGAAVTLKPFAALGLLTVFIGVAFLLAGVAELFSAADAVSRIGAVVLMATAILVAVLPAATIRAVAIAAGVGLMLSGVIRIAGGFRGPPLDRYVSVVSGLARLLLGVVALSWPDVTILVLALLVGPAVIVVGLGSIAQGLRRSPRSAATPGRRRLLRRLHGIWVTAALVLSVVLVLISVRINRASPTVDAFYSAPDTLPASPGQLLRSEPFGNGIPAGATAWRILYTTTTEDGQPGVASGLVVVGASTGAPRPVIAWTHGTTGVAQQCAPSVLAQPFGAGAMPDLDAALANGWAVVATDYLGLGTVGPHPYLVGKVAAYSELDAVRAARQLPAANLGTQTVAWGHSQGGAAALWVGIESKTYAPDVPLLGVAALAPASDLVALMNGLQTSIVGKVFGPFIVSGYSATYPDVKVADYIRPAARTIVDGVDERCLSEPATLVTVLTAAVTEQIWTAQANGGPLVTRLGENVPSEPTGIPTFVGQGAKDNLVLPDVQAAFIEKLCGAGQIIDYRTYAGLDHMGIIIGDGSKLPADLLEWTQARFDGTAPPAQCTTTVR